MTETFSNHMDITYLNNAATSFPKPENVRLAVAERINALPSGQFRSAGISDNGDIFSECRERLKKILNIKDPDRIFFSSGATESLNAVFAGLEIGAEHIITTVTEHNSVLRPLYNLPGIKGEPVLLPCDEKGYVSPEMLEKEAKKGKAKAVVLNHCSNVTGSIQDAASFGGIAKRYGLIFILDASQSAGCIPIEAEKWGVDALIFTGHKSLMGLQGTGGHYVREGLRFKPYKYGGTGLDSSRIKYTDDKYEYETGTQNALGIAALSAAAGFILEKGIDNIAEKENEIREYAEDRLSGIKGIRLIPAGGSGKGPVLSFVSELLSPGDLSYILQNSFNIVTRAGLMCAPLIHKYLGTEEKGTVRISFSLFQERKDIDRLTEALREIHEDKG